MKEVERDKSWMEEDVGEEQLRGEREGRERWRCKGKRRKITEMAESR